ncbi:HEAT repeat domain-containing protein [Chitinophaga filiformis]|uniref:HEAT repeat domain-containing protein n=1 Tax=Chitinophaga filiformis TaxID=104663 RepID=UPI001F356445|nr:HEAT repeat domain-containing protein [Chitinophaga filiformis]MCF6407026.1 HEAT repeat domain-containing protein [Chitinophaga filiformis]
MKKLLSIIFFLGCISVNAQRVQHPYAARINRILERLPAGNQEQLDSCMMQIGSLGAAGLTEMALMLHAPGKGDNTRLQLALSGYAAYISTASREEMRKTAMLAWSKALTVTKQAENKIFLIDQLQLFGDKRVVPVLKQYLLQPRFCDPAVRVLIHIGGSEPLIAMEAALEKVQSDTCEICLIKALGDLRYLAAESAIIKRTQSDNPVLRRTALFALANIVGGDSGPVLEAAAEKAGYGYDITGATAAYLLYVANLGHQWPTTPAMTAATNLLKRCKGDSLEHVRIAALKIVADVLDYDATNTLMIAADSKDHKYSAAALVFAARIMNAANAEAWIQKAERVDAGKRAAIIAMLANSKQRAAISLFTKALKDNDPQVRMAAIQAAGQLQSIEMLSPLLVAMKTADTSTAKAIGDVLLTIRSSEVPGHIAVAMQHAPSFMQVILLQVLAQKQAVGQERLIRLLLNSPDPAVVQAAKSTLSAIGL